MVQVCDRSDKGGEACCTGSEASSGGEVVGADDLEVVCGELG